MALTKTKQRVCGAPGCRTRINKYDSHDLCASCLSPSHFMMPRGSNPCPTCKHFDFSYRSRIYKRRQAGLPSFSPDSEVSSHQDDIELVASSEASDGSHGGSRPCYRETSTSRDADPLHDTSTHSGGGRGRRRFPRLLTKEKKAWDLFCLP